MAGDEPQKGDKGESSCLPLSYRIVSHSANAVPMAHLQYALAFDELYN